MQSNRQKLEITETFDANISMQFGVDKYKILYILNAETYAAQKVIN